MIRGLLKNLEDFANQGGDGLDPLVKMAIVHYQFEAIHPFHDGNGRTGRIVLILHLLIERLLDQPILFLSRYIIEHKSDYYRHLREVTEKGRGKRGFSTCSKPWRSPPRPRVRRSKRSSNCLRR